MEQPLLFTAPKRGIRFQDGAGRWYNIQGVIRALDEMRGWLIRYEHAGWEVEARVDMHADGNWHELVQTEARTS